jgi:hypothetical protein
VTLNGGGGGGGGVGGCGGDGGGQVVYVIEMYFGYSNIAYLAAMVALGCFVDYRVFLIGTSFVHYLRYINTYYHREGVAYGDFKARRRAFRERERKIERHSLPSFLCYINTHREGVACGDFKERHRFLHAKYRAKYVCVHNIRFEINIDIRFEISLRFEIYIYRFEISHAPRGRRLR